MNDGGANSPDRGTLPEKNGEHPYGDAGQLILLGLFLVVWVGDSFFVQSSTFLANYVPLFLRLIILVLSLAAAFALVRSGHVVVSHGERSTAVVSTGAFQYVRHPLYLGCLLFYFGLACATASLWSLALLVGIFLFYNYIAGYEEELLEARFGESYRTYKEKTGKWLPMVWG
ncbi:MAG: isoprenylcysteine carboxylmethyltransferase family protein [Syntrophobacterales bacterium]|jgi:protein-S-isoprenylcysteine O-methyltransferase Ste14